MTITGFQSLEGRRGKTAVLVDERLQWILCKPVMATEQEALVMSRSCSARLRLALRLSDR